MCCCFCCMCRQLKAAFNLFIWKRNYSEKQKLLLQATLSLASLSLPPPPSLFSISSPATPSYLQHILPLAKIIICTASLRCCLLLLRCFFIFCFAFIISLSLLCSFCCCCCCCCCATFYLHAARFYVVIFQPRLPSHAPASLADWRCNFSRRFSHKHADEIDTHRERGHRQAQDMHMDTVWGERGRQSREESRKEGRRERGR